MTDQKQPESGISGFFHKLDLGHFTLNASTVLALLAFGESVMAEIAKIRDEFKSLTHGGTISQVAPAALVETPAPTPAPAPAPVPTANETEAPKLDPSDLTGSASLPPAQPGTNEA